MADQIDQLWFVWVPGEDAPQMHRSLESASAQADLLARLHIGTRSHVYKLQSVGSIAYQDNPAIYGSFQRPLPKPE